MADDKVESKNGEFYSYENLRSMEVFLKEFKFKVESYPDVLLLNEEGEEEQTVSQIADSLSAYGEVLDIPPLWKECFIKLYSTNGDGKIVECCLYSKEQNYKIRFFYYNTDFIQLERKDYKESKDSKNKNSELEIHEHKDQYTNCNTENIWNVITKNYELKIHVSIDEYTSGNLGEGWDIIAKILTDNSFACFKLISPSKKLNFAQRGKQITIYLVDNIELTTVAKAMVSVEDQLRQNKINPCCQPIIRGSSNKPEGKIILKNSSKDEVSLYLSCVRTDASDNPICQNLLLVGGGTTSLSQLGSSGISIKRESKLAEQRLKDLENQAEKNLKEVEEFVSRIETEMEFIPKFLEKNDKTKASDFKKESNYILELIGTLELIIEETKVIFKLYNNSSSTNDVSSSSANDDMQAIRDKCKIVLEQISEKTLAEYKEKIEKDREKVKKLLSPPTPPSSPAKPHKDTKVYNNDH